MDRRFITTVALSVATIFLINYFFDSRSSRTEVNKQLQPGQFCKAPISDEIIKPLKKDIDFDQHAITQAEEFSVIDTPKARYLFSNYGGQLVEIEFKKHIGKNGKPLKTLYKKGLEAQAQGSFLIALDEHTPFVYELEDRTETAKTTTLTYAAKADGWMLRKTFVIHSDSYALDVTLAFDPDHGATSIKPRLFVAAPFVTELADDTINGTVLNEQGSALDRKEVNKETEGGFWVKPGFVGTEDKFFAHVLVGDAHHFVERSYFKRFTGCGVSTILEAPEITENVSYDLSFYCGPKLHADLVAVHERLEDLLSFGWLSWLCKMLLRLLSYLYEFFGNYGFAIIALTIIVKLPFAPLSMQAKRRMEEYQRYQPAINRLRTKFAHDIRLQHEEVMKFHKEHNISPTTQIFGCLPLLVQMPILFGLYRVLGSYLDLYQAPFVGWIVDLSARDPYYVLPLLMGVTMLWQQQLSPSTDGKQRVIGIFMSLLMVALFSSFPAGLVLYWIINNLLSVFEDLLRKAFI